MTSKNWILFLLFISIISLDKAAAEGGPSHASVRSVRVASALIPRDGVRRSRRSPSVRPARLKVRAYVKGLGRIEAAFDRQIDRGVVPTFTDRFGVHEDLTGVTLLRGRIRMAGGEAPLAGSIYNMDGEPVLNLAFVARKGGKNGDLHQLTVPIRSMVLGKRAHVGRVSRFKKTHDFCAEPLKAKANFAKSVSHAVAKASSDDVSASGLKVVELNLDADSAWFSIFGSNSNTVISTLVNVAETIYENQLNLTYTIVRQNVFTSRSFSTSDPELKLESYQDYTIAAAYYGTADAYHLFTGVDLASTTIGIAYVGVICTSEANSFGLSQAQSVSSISSSDLGIATMATTFAHELGHNFNAQHDLVNTQTVMGTQVTNPPSQTFSTPSKNTINSWVSQNGSCLADGSGGTDPTPTPTPTPTPGGGGGDGGNGDGGIGVTLAASVDSTGLFTATVTVSEVGTDCEVDVYGGTKKKKLARARSIFSFPLTATSMALQATVPKRALTFNAFGETAGVFLKAQVICYDSEGGLESFGNSNAVKLKANKVASPRIVYPDRWIRSLGKALLTQ